MEDEILETHDLIQDVYQYLKSGCYPQILQDVNRKRIIRKKALRFVLNDGELYVLQAEEEQGKEKPDVLYHK